MAAINHLITEEQLEETKNAIVAIQTQKGHTYAEAMFTAQNLIWLVFRNVITLDSVHRTIVNNARKVYVQ